MADRPILFSAPMIRALLEGRKSQTRRVVKPQPSASLTKFAGFVGIGATKGAFVDPSYPPADPEQRKIPINVGDRLWCRETWGSLEADHTAASREPGYRKPRSGDRIVYQADPGSAAQWGSGLPSQGSFMWRPSIHMPRFASRITLIVTDVRVQRLQDISEDDALEEGVPDDNNYAGSFEREYCRRCGGSSVHAALGAGYGVCEVDCVECETAKMRYRNLWEHINGIGSWQANPWIVAYTFRTILKNIDEVA